MKSHSRKLWKSETKIIKYYHSVFARIRTATNYLINPASCDCQSDIPATELLHSILNDTPAYILNESMKDLLIF